jgi:hypothetical protein
MSREEELEAEIVTASRAARRLRLEILQYKKTEDIETRNEFTDLCIECEKEEEKVARALDELESFHGFKNQLRR